MFKIRDEFTVQSCIQ